MSTDCINVLKAQRLAPSYQSVQDRIRLDLDDDQGKCLSLWLTRRLAVRLLPALANKLKITHGVAARLPESLRANVLAMEHVSVTIRPRSESESAFPLKVVGEPLLLQTIELRQRGDALVLYFCGVDSSELALLPANRAVLHQFAGALVRHMRRASWLEAVSLDWLDEFASPAEQQAPAGALLN